MNVSEFPSPWGSRLGYGTAALGAVSCVATLGVVFLLAPVESTMGIVQKIFYFHVPAAYAMYLGALACFVGSAGYLAAPAHKWDALGRAGADVAVAMGVMVMISGPLWATKAWGRPWVWEPRLTTALLSFLVYVAYLVLRAFSGGGEGERRFAAALGVLGAANLPIIHLAVRWWGGQHPNVIGPGGGGLHHPDMKLALGMGFATFTLIAGALLVVRTRLHLAAIRLAEVEQRVVSLDVDEPPPPPRGEPERDEPPGGRDRDAQLGAMEGRS
jgi:heme exporter protein C